ncbi:MAG: FAD-dependent oxidoreductase [bacterium]
MEHLYNKKYDYIIYGGSITGVFYALFYKSKGADVLLVNKYGFLGGGITENLCLLQDIYSMNIHKFNKLILDTLGEKNCYKTNIYQHVYEYFVNHEQLKFVLQDLLVKHNVNLLYHVKAVEPVKDNKLVLMGKEGKIIIEGNKIIDCSDNFYLYFLDGNINYTHGFYNFVVVGNDKDKLKKLVPNADVTQIGDNRYLINLIINFDDVLTVENTAHDLMNIITPILIQNNYRIELLPVETFLMSKFNEDYQSPKFEPIYEYKSGSFISLIERSILVEKCYEFIK